MICALSSESSTDNRCRHACSASGVSHVQSWTVQDPQRRGAAIGPRGIAGELLVGDVRVVLVRTDRLHRVDPRARLTSRELSRDLGSEPGAVDERREAVSLPGVRWCPGLPRPPRKRACVPPGVMTSIAFTCCI